MTGAWASTEGGASRRRWRGVASLKLAGSYGVLTQLECGGLYL